MICWQSTRRSYYIMSIKWYSQQVSLKQSENLFLPFYLCGGSTTDILAIGYRRDDACLAGRKCMKEGALLDEVLLSATHRTSQC